MKALVHESEQAIVLATHWHIVLFTHGCLELERGIECVQQDVDLERLAFPYEHAAQVFARCLGESPCKFPPYIPAWHVESGASLFVVRAQHSPEPGIATRDIVQLTRLVGCPEDATILSQRKCRVPIEKCVASCCAECINGKCSGGQDGATNGSRCLIGREAVSGRSC